MSIAIGTQSIEKLNDTNYESWKIQIKSVLVCNELWKYVNGTEVCTNENKSTWTTKDEKALALILLSISKNQLNHIKKATTSYEAWEKLRNTYESKGPVRKSVLYKQLYRMKKNKEQSMMEYISSFVDKVEQLEDAGIKLPNEFISIILLNSLPTEYENFCIVMESRDTVPEIDFIKEKLIEEEARRIDQDDHNNRDLGNDALIVSNKKGQNTKNPHTKQVKTQKFTGKCYKCNKVGHKSTECWNKPKRQAGNNVHDAMFACAQYTGSQGSRQWCLDSGATSHMCHDKMKFNEIDTSRKCNVYTATDDAVESRGTGDVRMKVTLKNNKVNDIKLKDAMLVLRFSNNLLSVSRMTDNDYTVTFKKKCALVNRQDGSTALVARRQGQLYIVDEAEQSRISATREAKDDRFLRWQQRFGHLNLRDLSKLNSKGMVSGLNISSNRGEFDCEICNKCKIHQLPFKSSTKREKERLGLIHSDICGPMNVPSLGGARYFVTFVDDKSRYVEVAMLKKRPDVITAFKTYKRHAEKETGCKIKKIRTDNAKEYVSKEFNDFLKEEGIRRQLSVEYCPQQNGVAERANRTLVEMARCMLLQSGVPGSLWAEVINTAAYIRNRCPTQALEDLTPMEAWSNEKPYVGFMRIFGSKVVALEKKSLRGKFEPKGRNHILVGYSQESKAYRLWTTGTKTVIKRRDVRFIEDIEDSTSNSEENCEILFNPNINEPEKSAVTCKESSGDEEEPNEEEREEEHILEIPRRRSGRPKLIRTGKRGRPRKMYQEMTNDRETLDEPSSLGEISNREDEQD